MEEDKSMEKLIELLESKLASAKFYKNVCNNEITKLYIKEAIQIYNMIVKEILGE